MPTTLYGYRVAALLHTVIQTDIDMDIQQQLIHAQAMSLSEPENVDATQHRQHKELFTASVSQ